MGPNQARYARQAAGAAAAWARVGVVAAVTFGQGAAREAARINSYTTPTVVLSAEDAGADAKIVVLPHTRVYPVQGTVDVPDVEIDENGPGSGVAAEITGLAFATTYYVYYDDTTLADPAPIFVATEDSLEAQVGFAPGRHLVGVVTTPADGGTSTSGSGGSTPPGGGGGTPIDHRFPTP